MTQSGDENSNDSPAETSQGSLSQECPNEDGGGDTNKSKDRAEEELDFEEGFVEEGEEKSNDVPKNPLVDPVPEQDEGQVNSDDELEEGEVKEDDDDTNGGQGNNQPPIKPMGGIIPFVPLPLPKLPPDFYPGHPGFLPPPQVPRPVSESGWERGIKTARDRVARANERKEKDVDFNEKRLNAGVEDDDRYYRHHQPPRDSRDDYYQRDRRSSDYHHSSSSSYHSSSRYYDAYESRGSRHYDPPPPPRDDRYRRESKESEYERRQRLALESAPRDWQEDRRRYNDHPKSSERGSGYRRPDDYVDPYKPDPRAPGNPQRAGSPYSSFSDTSGSGLNSSESDFSDSWSEDEGKERKKRTDYKTKSHSASAAPKPTNPNDPMSKRIPRLSDRNKPEHVRPNYDGHRDDRYGSERPRGVPPRPVEAIENNNRSRSRSDMRSSMSSNSDPERSHGRRDIGKRGARDSLDEVASKRTRGGYSRSPDGLSPPPHSKEASFSMSLKGKSKTSIAAKAFNNSESGDEDDIDSRPSALSPVIGSPTDNSLSPGFEHLSTKQQIEHLQKMPDSSSRRKALLEQLRVVEAAIAKKKKT